MRDLQLVVLALTAVAVTDGHFGGRGGRSAGGGGGAGGHHDGWLGFNRPGEYVNTQGQVGGDSVGALVDPNGWFQQGADDHGHSTGQVEKCPAIADIIVVLDTSSSMTQQEFELERDFAIRLTEHFDVGSGDVRFGAITFSDRVQESFRLGSYSSNEAVKTAFRNTTYLGGGTRTDLALDHIYDNRLFSTDSGARERSSRIVIVLTDGYSENRFASKQAAIGLRNYWATIITVGIGGSFSEELNYIASANRLVFSADSFNSLTRIEQSVATGICSIPESEGYIPQVEANAGGQATKRCPNRFEPNPDNPSTCIEIDECKTSNPCQQTCVNLPGSVRCTCKADYVINTKNTTKCDALRKCTDLVDIVFLVDASGSIGSDNFKMQQRFVAKLTNHFAIGPKGVQIAGVMFATEVKELFKLNTYSSRTDIKWSLLGAPYGEGGTNTHLGINHIVDKKLFSPASGGRSNAPDVVIVITDGESGRPEETKQAAARLKQQGAIVVAVGVGLQVNTKELIAIARSEDDVFVVSGFDLLDYIEQILINRICPSTLPQDEGNEGGQATKKCPGGFEPNPNNPSTCIDINECKTSNPCQQTCVNLPGSVRCICEAGYVINTKNTTKCDAVRQCTDLVDIVFLVDASGNIGSHNFKLQQRFVAKLTHHFIHGLKAAQFAGVMFATEVKELFKLNTHPSRNYISSDLLGVSYGQGITNTHLGINHIVDKKLLSSASGGRSNAPDVVIVVTNGASARPEETKQAAARLKQQGATVVAVGVGSKVNSDELKTIASSSDDVFVVSDFDLLDYIEQSLTNRICPSTRP